MFLFSICLQVYGTSSTGTHQIIFNEFGICNNLLTGRLGKGCVHINKCQMPHIPLNGQRPVNAYDVITKIPITYFGPLSCGAELLGH